MLRLHLMIAPSRLALLVCLAIVCAACEKADKSPEPEPVAPLRVALGDCGAGTTLFESGPRPAPAEDVTASDEALARATEWDRVAAKLRESSGDGATIVDPDQLAQSGILGLLATDDDGVFGTLTGTADFSSGLDDSDVHGGLLGNDPGITGGWGYGISGVGPGGGGSGWGTIGGGRYGTIGGGGGTGSGGGGGRGSGAVPPAVRIGNASATGDLDKNIIRRYIRRKLPRIRYCYEKQLLVRPKLAGTIVTNFQISPEGSVQGVTASGMSDKEVESCVASAIKSIQFPKPKGGGFVNVRYPFTFQVAGSSTADPPDQPEPEPEPQPEPEPVPAPATDDSSEAHSQSIESNRKVGDHSLLKGAEVAIRGCLQATGRADHGVLVVELSADKSGAVTAQRTTGTASEEQKACVTKAVQKVSVKPSELEERTYRCPLAYGEMAAAELPTVEITANKIRFNGRDLVSVATLKGASAVPGVIEPLYDAVMAEDERRAALADSNLVSITGPIVVRPAPTSNALLLERVLRTVSRVSPHVVLAAERGGQWQLLRDIELPAVPVSSETGTSWWYSDSMVSRDPAAVIKGLQSITLRVTQKEYSVGRLGSRQTIVERRGDRNDLVMLKKALAGAIEGPDIEEALVTISYDESIPYRDLTDVIDQITGRDRVSWMLVQSVFD